MRTFAACIILSACGLALAADKKDDKRSDLDDLQGHWVVSSAEGFGKETPADELKSMKLVIKDHQMTAQYGEHTVKATLTLDQAAVPQKLDVKVTDGPDEVRGKTFACIYLLEGPVFKVAFRKPGEKRPSEFITRNRTDLYEVRFKKAPK